MKKQYPPEDFTADVVINQQEQTLEISKEREEEQAAAWAEFEAEMRMLNAENDFLNYK